MSMVKVILAPVKVGASFPTSNFNCPPVEMYIHAFDKGGDYRDAIEEQF